MRLMLDTSVLIEIEHDNAAVLDRLKVYKPREVGMSAIALIELEVGVVLGAYRKKNRASLDWLIDKFQVVPFDARAAKSAAVTFARHQLKNDMAGTFDALIAAHAASLQLPLAYADGDFNRFPGRKMLWQAEPRTLR